MSEDPARRHALVEQLASDDPEQQADVLRQICNSGAVLGLCQQVIGLSGSKDEDVRMWSAEALEAAVQPTSADIPGLVEKLTTSSDGEICYWSATMLGRLGTEAADASEALANFAEKSDFLAARERAVWALCQVGPAAKHAIETLQRVAEGAPPRLQRLAEHAIETLQNETDEGGEKAA